ncbi:hypothetical protein IJG78_00515 [Candidatus Saccharibacteria bacterium]|nr:hypothetical protein [Candidatus Saccharibacteria bacterium]
MKILEILAKGQDDIKATINELPNHDTGVTSGNLNNVINWVLGAAGLVAVGIIIYGAVKYLTSQGAPDKTKQASQIIAFAVIGLAVVALAFAITNFVLGAIGESTK